MKKDAYFALDLESHFYISSQYKMLFYPRDIILKQVSWSVRVSRNEIELLS